MSVGSNNLGARALELHRLGLSVFPVRARDKRPAMKWEPFQSTRATEDEVRAWWLKQPDANIGVACGPVSGVVVVDVDGESGAATIARLEREHGPMPPTWQSTTGRGMHLWFRWPADVEIGNSAGRIGEDVDVRGRGGYVVAPGSIHPTGAVYAWVEGSDPARGMQPADLPPWLIDSLAGQRPNRDTARPANDAGPRLFQGFVDLEIAEAIEAVRSAPEGTRNSTLNAAAFRIAQLVASGHAKETRMRAALDGAALAAGLPQAEIAATIESAFRAGLAQPRAVPGPRQHGGNGEAAPESALDAEVRRLAALSPPEYDHERKGAAEQLGIRVTTLDAAVKQHRPSRGAENRMQGRALAFDPPEPWPEPVDGAALLDDIAATFRRFVVLPEAADVACALWVLHSYAFESSYITPRLAITSPEKGCGKSTLLDVLGKLVLRPLSAANVSVAVLFRVIEQYHPSILLDEAETFMRDNEELRGIINSGHAKRGHAARIVGDDLEPHLFSTFAPIAIAAIGKLPGTIMDRSIVVTMRRRRAGESVERLRLDREEPFASLGRRCARWASDNLSALASADPEMPATFENRIADNWRPLLAIADTAGGDWPERARTAAQTLVANHDDSPSAAVLLLADIAALFAERVEDRLFSGDIASALAAMEDRPWPEWGKAQKPITARQVAGLLGPFGIMPATIRIGGKTAKGYMRDAFADAFARYLPARSVTPSQVAPDGAFFAESIRNKESAVTDREPQESPSNGDCDGVTDREAGPDANEGRAPWRVQF